MSEIPAPAAEPYFPTPQPAAPPEGDPTPAPEAAAPAAPPQSFQIDPDATIPLGLRKLKPVDDVFTDDEWAPHQARPARNTPVESRTVQGALSELRGRQPEPRQLSRLASSGTQSAGLRELQPLDDVFTDDGWTPHPELPRRLVRMGFESVD
jgi:hypothetical protein